MDILNQLETHPIPIDEEEKRRTRRFLIGLICAVLLTGLVFGGYIYLRKRHERQVAAAAELEVKKNAPKVEVLVDDAMVNGKATVLGGTVNNISTEALPNLAVELQLRRRLTGASETKFVAIDTPLLPAGGSARYSVEVVTQDYSTSTFLRVVTGDNKTPVAFRAMAGAPRPPMDAPGSKTVVVGGAPRPSGKGDEFINTPNNPGRVP